MTQVILSDDQARAVQRAGGAVELRDRHGKLVGYVSPPPRNEVIAEAKRRLNSGGPWHTTQQVVEHLQSLEQG